MPNLVLKKRLTKAGLSPLRYRLARALCGIILVGWGRGKGLETQDAYTVTFSEVGAPQLHSADL
jgi:hypothetical protein